MKSQTLAGLLLSFAFLFINSGCSAPCVAAADCASQNTTTQQFTCVSGACVVGSPGDGGSTGGGAGTGGGTGGGAATGGGSATGGGTTGGGTGEQTDAGLLTVRTTTPLDNALGVSVTVAPMVTFSVPVDPASLTTSTFTLTSGSPPVAVAVDGSVSSLDAGARFLPTAHLALTTQYTATVTTGVHTDAGVALTSNHTWRFTTGLAPSLPVNLRTSESFAILAKTAVSTVPPSAVTGSVGISPAAASFITGFSLAAPPTTSTTSTQITGLVFAADFDPPTPSNLTTAVSDMLLAYADAAARPASVTELGAGNIGGMVLTAGVYQWGTGLLIPTDLTLTGNATDVFIFQVAQNLTVSNGVRINLSGGALPKNVFWQVAGAVELGTTAHAEGVMLSQTAITLRTGASVNGRLLAQTAVNLDSNVVVQPAP